MQKYFSDLELAARYNVHRITIWKWYKSGAFPKPVHLSPGCTRWRLETVEAHEAKIAAEAA